MREQMSKMEEERSQMIAEVEMQIERALASMAVDMDDSDYGGSRPSSRLSSRSAPSTLRRSGDRPLRSFSTESTLAESYADDNQDFMLKTERVTTTVPEEDEESEEVSRLKKKRFSATGGEVPQHDMSAVDEGISQKSDHIAQKVLQIQRKVVLQTSYLCSTLIMSFHSLNQHWARTGDILQIVSIARVTRQRPPEGSDHVAKIANILGSLHGRRDDEVLQFLLLVQAGLHRSINLCLRNLPNSLLLLSLILT